jgi:peptidoglycan/LPS O-acetylase OafA/YrhL
MRIQHKKGHIASLDGIRGIAILLVLFFHCFENIPVFPVNYISEIGWVGVDLFFVLSGFLITGILVDSKGRENYLTGFFAKRALRIFPLYYLTLALFFLVLQIPRVTSANPAFDTRHFQSIQYYLTFTQNLYFSFNGWGVTDILNHFWSLAIEEQFYMVWPFILYYSNTNTVLVICIGLILTSLVTRNLNADSDFSYVFTLSRVDALGIGSMMAILIRHYSAYLNKYVLPVFFTTLACLIVILINSDYLHFRNPYFVRIGYTLFALMFSCIIAFVYDQNKLGLFTNRVLSIKVLTFFGTYSYGIYIYHWLLYKGVYVYLDSRYHFPKLYILPFLGIVILISVLSFHTYEKFFLRFKSKFDVKDKGSAVGLV